MYYYYYYYHYYYYYYDRLILPGQALLQGRGYPVVQVIYIYIYNPHLGLINAPPLICWFPSKRPLSLFIYYQKGQTSTNFWPRLY